MGWYIGLGTIPIAIFGFLFRDQIETGARSLYLVGTTLIVLGLLLLLADRTAKLERDISDIKPRDAALIGFAQALALIPGVSRSGATITAGLLAGFDRASAARYSFLLSVPAVVLSGLFEARKIGDEGGAAFVPTLLATIAAFIVGYASIAWLLRWLTSHSMTIFVVYRVVLGARRDHPDGDGRDLRVVAFYAHGRPRTRAPGAVRLPPAGGEDPRRLLLRRVLQPDQVAAGGRRPPPASADAGLPAPRVDPRAGSTRRSRC